MWMETHPCWHFRIIAKGECNAFQMHFNHFSLLVLSPIYPNGCKNIFLKVWWHHTTTMFYMYFWGIKYDLCWDIQTRYSYTELRLVKNKLTFGIAQIIDSEGFEWSMNKMVILCYKANCYLLTVVVWWCSSLLTQRWQWNPVYLLGVNGWAIWIQYVMLCSSSKPMLLYLLYVLRHSSTSVILSFLCEAEF